MTSRPRQSLAFAWAFVPSEQVDSPNLKRKGLRRTGRSPANALQQYYVCLAVSCASARRWHPDARLVLFTPSDRPAWFERVQSQLAVETVAQPFQHLPPDAEIRRDFVTSTYTLDVVEWIARHGSNEETWIVLDPDTVIVGPVDGHRFARMLGGLWWPLEPANYFNGLSHAKYLALRPTFGLCDGVEPIAVGGEFLAGSTDVFGRLSAEVEKVWRANLALRADAEPPLKTEEHVLSFVFPKLEADNSQDLARRIFTHATYRTVDGTEADLRIWHLPGEKGRGFRRVLTATRNPDSWFWRAPRNVFIAEIGKRMNVTQRSLVRRMRDWTAGLRQHHRRRPT